MASSAQELLGVNKALDRLERRIETYRAFLLEMSRDRHPSGDIEKIAITDGEVETVEALIIRLSKRSTGARPVKREWEAMHPYCSRNERKDLGKWSDQNYEYFRWSLLWIQKTRAYVEYLSGLQNAEAEPRHAKAKITNQTIAIEAPQYDIAISFAGEDRAHARILANRLRSLDLLVFYDEYEQASLWGRDLYTHLSDIYQNRARYCLMLISENYAKKLWTKRERESAQARAFRESSEYILPLRLDDTVLPGVEETVGYLDLRSTTYEEVVRLLVEKLKHKNI